MRLLPRFRPRPEDRPMSVRPPGDAAVRIRWLGTAGHVVEAGGATLLIDPFLSRPGLLSTAARPLKPAVGRFARWLPARADAVLVGHGHYDHLMDAPEVARAAGATLVGSESVASFGRAAGLPEDRIVEVPATGRTLVFGGAEVRFIPSLHARLLAGRVPFPGRVTEPPRLPARLHHYRVGSAFGIVVTGGGCTVYHNGSADLVDAELDGIHADVALVGIAGRQVTPRYLPRLLSLLSPSLVVPTHHDAFFAPLADGVRLLPGVDLDGFLSEARSLSPSARRITPLYEDVLHVPAGDARAAVLTSW